MKVTSAKELAAAIDAKEQVIEVDGTISGSPSITLPEGTTLTGGALEFKAKGVRLTKDNTVKDITITTTNYEQAIYNDTSIEDAGTLRLENVETVGQVYIVANQNLTNVRVEADGVFVKEADVRGRAEQPHGFGVDVLQGGFTLWNQQPNEDTTFTTTLRGIRVGTEKTPVRGSGVFLGGYGDREGFAAGGLLTGDVLETGEIFTDGGIAEGAPDKITGGVFLSSGAQVDSVVNSGPVTTSGANDMVLDLWGTVKSWEAKDAVTSHGPSGIGFVNFGTMGRLDITAPITTTGKGARGFNLYDGHIESAHFHSIATTGDGSIGIQVSRPMGPLVVDGDVTTQGGEGTSLVRGVQVELKAIGISIKDGADIPEITIGGTVSTQGDELNSVEVLEGAKVGTLKISNIEAKGTGSQTLSVAPGSVDTQA